jgi:hypothetical protein
MSYQGSIGRPGSDDEAAIARVHPPLIEWRDLENCDGPAVDVDAGCFDGDRRLGDASDLLDALLGLLVPFDPDDPARLGDSDGNLASARVGEGDDRLLEFLSLDEAFFELQR